MSPTTHTPPEARTSAPPSVTTSPPSLLTGSEVSPLTPSLQNYQVSRLLINVCVSLEECIDCVI